MGVELSINFDASYSLLDEMERIIDMGKRQHEEAIQNITHQVSSSFAHLPTIHSLMDILIDHMQTRPEDLRSYFEEDWLPAMRAYVDHGHADEMQLSQQLPDDL